MPARDDEDRLILATALQNAASVLQARQRAEDELARAVALLRATLEATTDALLVVERDGKVTECNELFARLWRLDREHIRGLSQTELAELLAVRSADARRVMEASDWNDFRIPSEVDTLELTDGRIVECSCAPQVVDGVCVGRVWSFRDVTERKRVDSAIAAVHARFAAVVDQSPAGILIVDAQARLQHVNPRALSVFGEDSPLVGRSLQDVLKAVWSREVVDDVVAHYWSTLATGVPVRSEQPCELSPDRGVEAYHDWAIHRIALADGQLGIACYLIDVTSHVQSTRALRESEQRVRATFEQVGVGMAIARLDGRLIQMNRKFTEILGYTEEELRGRTMFELTHPDDMEVTLANVRRLVAREVDHYSLEKRYIGAGGSVVWSLTTVAMLTNERGAPVEFVGVIEDISARKVGEMQVRESAQRLQLALSAGSLGAWSWDASSHLVTLSDRAAEVCGVPAGAPIPWSDLRSLLHDDDLERARLAVEASLLGGADYDIEHRIVKRSGDMAWVAARGRVVRDVDGTPRGMIGVVQDVTDRRRLESSRLRLAAVVECSDDAIFSKTLHGIITTWNAAAERMFGYTADEIVGQPGTVLIPHARRHEDVEIQRRLVAGQRVDHFETVRVRKDGTEFPVSVAVSPIIDAQGNIIGVSKIARDVTARKRAEDALREESRILNLLNRTGQSIAAALNLPAIVQTVTDAATQLSGAQFGAFLYDTSDAHQHASQLFAASGAPNAIFERVDEPWAAPLFAPTFRGEGPIRSDDVTIDPRCARMPPHEGSGAEPIPVRSWLAVPVVSRSGRVIGGLFFGHAHARQFTERAEQLIVGVAAQAAIAIDNARLYEDLKRAADERQVLLDAERAARLDAERASVMKDEFLATLSHELRTPLNAIVGWAHVLRTRVPADPEVEEGLSVIDRNAKVQAQLIEDLLDMSRIISGKLRIQAQRVEFQSVVKAAVESVKHSADARSLRLQIDLEPRPCVVWGDPNRLQQCIWNLLSNAIKFTPRGGTVRATLVRLDQHLELRIVDTGQGIAEEFLPYVFERFRQADASTTRRYGGLGLGLSIVKSLVELHGGVVGATSAGKGRGATFSIELPLMSSDDVQSMEPHARTSTADVGSSSIERSLLRGLSVLIVDDDPDARTFVKRILEDCGARVLVAESAQAGLALLQDERPDVVLSDIGMPEEDGYEFMRKVRRLPADQGGRTPAAALSAFARAEDCTRALLAGYQLHIAKPLRPTELTAAVASLVQQP